MRKTIRNRGTMCTAMYAGFKAGGKEGSCARCGAALPDRSATERRRTPITGGLCRACEAALGGEDTVTLRDFIDRLDIPVLVMESDVRVLMGNRIARRNLGKSIPALTHRRLGGIIDCRNAARPGGCGLQNECNACRLRAAVLHTMRTGRARRDLEVTQTLLIEGEIVQERFLISTEKVDGYVMLRLQRAE